MIADTAWLIGLGPLALVLAAAFPTASPAVANRLAFFASAFAFAVAIAGGVVVATFGPVHTAIVGSAAFGAGIYLDVISAVMDGLVAFVGLVVIEFSRRYLEGDPRQALFTRLLCGTLASVLFAIVAGHLVAFAAGWIAMSVTLHYLLVFYPERPAAVVAGRKKFVASRIGDMCLIAALVLLYARFHTLAYADLFPQLDSAAIVGASPTIAAVLLCICALLQSAQFPSHGWIVEVMETPTPVSALLHAGIVNAGGFLILRFAHAIAGSLPALDLLAVIGGFTAIFGSVVMLAQTSIKVSLTYSTIAQMGFMMLECGLGAFGAALLHIVAHSLYKAHAFLSSGSVIDIARASWTPSPGGKPHPRRLAFAVVGALVLAGLIGRAYGATLVHKPGVAVFGSVLLLGMVHLIAAGIDERPNVYVVGRAIGGGALVAVVFFTLQAGFERLIAPAVPPLEAIRGPFETVVAIVVVGMFALVTFEQGQLGSRAGTRRWRAFYAWVASGLYVNTVANRLVLALWPRRKGELVEGGIR